MRERLSAPLLAIAAVVLAICVVIRHIKRRRSAAVSVPSANG